MPQIKPPSGNYVKPQLKVTSSGAAKPAKKITTTTWAWKTDHPELPEKKKNENFTVVRMELVSAKPCHRRIIIKYVDWYRFTLHFFIVMACFCLMLATCQLLHAVINCLDVDSGIDKLMANSSSPTSSRALRKNCFNLFQMESDKKKYDYTKEMADEKFLETKFTGPQSCSIVQEQIDCLPRGPYNKETCIQRGCCWSEGAMLPTGVPICFFPLKYGSYSNLNVTKGEDKITAFMQNKVKSPYPSDINLLKFEACYESKSRLHVKITDATKDRFESPYPKVPRAKCLKTPLSNYGVEIRESHMGFKVLRHEDQTVIFDAEDIGALTYADQFLQISGKFPPGSGLYGIGEQQGPLAIDTKQYQTFTLWNHDVAPRDKVNLYGSHPFLLVRDRFDSHHSKWHGLFFLNSNGQEIITQPGPSVTFRTIGGIFDFYWFLGDTPGQVISQYAEIVGMPQIPPYWGLGFHLCRFGYNSLERTIQVWNQTRAAGIPFDVQWNDLDYMDKGNDFTFDKVKYAGLPEFVDKLHKVHMHYIPLIDPGISAGEKAGTYAPYDEGLKLGVFIKDETDRPFVGKVWNRVSTVWPDFTNPQTANYWLDNLRKMHDEVPFDGAWIDMNEPSNFWDGTKHGCPTNSYNNPPYVPSVDGGQLYYKTVCPSAKQYAGLHYDVHNLYGISEAEATNYAMSTIRAGKRSVIISRSTFPGHGFYASHWTGDVFSTWFDMQRSIPQILNFNMFGIPFVGADICGFNGNTTVELCARWMQLGAFYPFSRNHNTDDAIDQDPVSLGEVVETASRKALQIRYTLLPYLYNLFYQAHVAGETVARPLFFEFPHDNKTFTLDTQFMWGSCVHIIPVLEEGKTAVNAYLPAGKWYDWNSIKTWDLDSGDLVKLAAPLDSMPVLIKGGCVLPTHAPEMTTYDSRQNPLTLAVFLNKTGGASGSLFWDDGESLGSLEEKQYTLMDFVVTGKSLHATGVVGYKLPQLGAVLIYGECDPVTKVTFHYNGVSIDIQARQGNCTLDVPLYCDVTSGFDLVWN